MSGPLFNTKPLSETSENGELRLKMDLVPITASQSNDDLGRKWLMFSLEKVHTGRVPSNGLIHLVYAALNRYGKAGQQMHSHSPGESGGQGGIRTLGTG